MGCAMYRHTPYTPRLAGSVLTDWSNVSTSAGQHGIKTRTPTGSSRLDRDSRKGSARTHTRYGSQPTPACFVHWAHGWSYGGGKIAERLVLSAADETQHRTTASSGTPAREKQPSDRVLREPGILYCREWTRRSILVELGPARSSLDISPLPGRLTPMRRGHGHDGARQSSTPPVPGSCQLPVRSG